MSGPLPIEQEAIAGRRSLYGIPAEDPQCGLALSGGGIRSATFSLGLLRGLSSLHLLGRIDYLSTVSGGGYAGAFFCGLFSPRDDQRAIIDPEGDSDLLGQDDARKALAYLRQSGRYLTPTGGRDYVFAVTMLARNWIALVLVVGAAILFDEIVLDALRILAAYGFGRASAWFGHPMQLYTFISPLVFAIPVLLWLIVGFGWAYWLTLGGVTEKSPRPPLIGTVLILLASMAASTLLVGSVGGWLAGMVVSLSIFALAAWLRAARLIPKPEASDSGHRRAIYADRVRHRIAMWQSGCSNALLVIGLLAIADMLTFVFAVLEQSGPSPFNLAALLPPLMTVVVPAGQWLLKKVAATRENAPRPANAAKPSWFDRLATPLTWFVALVLCVAALAFWGNIAHHLMWRNVDWRATEIGNLTPLAPWAWAICGLFVLLASKTQGFVNLSSLASFYADRLCRAYLGAGNRERIGATDAKKPGDATSVQDDEPHDDLGLSHYYSNMHGGPVHLINITINETHGKGPATVQRDRHGLNLTISPDGFSYSEVAGAPPQLKALGSEAWSERAQRALEPPGQSLPLSSWIGISGAAFSTGLGSQTSLARSLLAFVANVRLGFWWQADRSCTKVDSSYINLRRELIGSFPGTARPHWYLSDGGHFENTGVYELVRRRVPLIIVSDNGCDPGFGFEDVANLVRKSRIDFGAQIDFLHEAQLDRFFAADDGDLRSLFAEPTQFALDQAPVGAVAMLARITFADSTFGTLLAIKPRLTRDGPSDLMRYLADNPEFPQQTTFDQFFDEAQWESYYELGRRIAIRLFDRRSTEAVWQPAHLTPVPEWEQSKMPRARSESC